MYILFFNSFSSIFHFLLFRFRFLFLSSPPRLRFISSLPYGQLAAPHDPVIACVGDAYTMRVSVSVPRAKAEAEEIGATAKAFMFLLNQPLLSVPEAVRDNLLRDGSLPATYTTTVPCAATVVDIGEVDPAGSVPVVLELQRSEFATTGYYDWRVVSLDKQSDGPTVNACLCTGGGVAQGRWIVHREGMREEVVHQVSVDLQVRQSHPQTAYSRCHHG